MVCPIYSFDTWLDLGGPKFGVSKFFLSLSSKIVSCRLFKAILSGHIARMFPIRTLDSKTRHSSQNYHILSRASKFFHLEANFFILEKDQSFSF